MSNLRNSTRWWIPAFVLILVLGLAVFAVACGEDEGETETTEAPEGETETTEAEGDGEMTEGGTIRFGLIPWDEDIAATYLWKHILEEQGYTVELTQLDVAPVYSGLAQGDLDLFLDAWLPITHEDYWAEFGPELEDLAIWYDNGLLTLAVPDYVELDSIADLDGQADMFGGQIIGIEPGAGLMRVTREDVMPGYGLDDEYTLVEGSTPAMLAELERATNAEEPIVVTLWHPHWAYSAFPIKDLEDPQGLMGEAEEIHAVARGGFSEDFPEVAEWISNFVMTDAQLASLEELVINEYGEGQEEQAVEEWLSDEANQEVVNGWLGQ